MNIRTRLKTPFNPVKHIEPKPSVKPFAGKDESELGAEMLAMARAEGKARNLPKSRGGGEAVHEGSLSQRVLCALVDRGWATTKEVHEDFPEHSKDRISKTLGDLRRRGLVKVLEKRCEGTSHFNVWGLAND